jgi:hypothetical protein
MHATLARTEAGTARVTTTDHPWRRARAGGALLEGKGEGGCVRESGVDPIKTSLTLWIVVRF